MTVPGPPNHLGETQYGEYLEVVEKLRDLWYPQGPVDVVEYQLFIAGGRKTPIDPSLSLGWPCLHGV